MVKFPAEECVRCPGRDSIPAKAVSKSILRNVARGDRTFKEGLFTTTVVTATINQALNHSDEPATDK
ncbi:hypothetical protein V492_07657 [Pseudogymnoascus sp. VKM F-4246]|nr:hypothetical protein V492_07657 [Pseudogymnoascus sp. VKM F-4246]